MSDQWHYMRGGNQGGPVSAAEIRNMAASGRLAPTDLLWNDGMTDWTPLERIPGFMGGATAASAATPYSSPATMPPDAKGRRRYGRIQGLALSLSSGPLYRDVARNWGGIGMLYLLLLFALTWIPVLVKIQIGVNQYVHDELPKELKDFPTINSNRAGLGFDALLRLAAVGMTLSVYVDTVFELAGVAVPFWFWFLIAAAMTTGYVAFGVKAAIAEEPAAV